MIPLNRTCKEATAILVAREDREVPFKEGLALRLHLLLCGNCQIFERQMLTMRNAFKQWRGYQDSEAP